MAANQSEVQCASYQKWCPLLPSPDACMPDKSIFRDWVVQLAISPRTSDKSTRPTSEAFPNNPGTLVQSETNQGTEPKWLDNLSHLLGLSSVRPFGDFATCGAKGIPRYFTQHSSVRGQYRNGSGTPLFIAATDGHGAWPVRDRFARSGLGATLPVRERE